MNRLLTILLLTLVTSFAFAEKRALVIGIGAYPDVDYGWHTINGDNDIPLAVEMLRCNGFQLPNIVTLANEQATYSGITAALQTLIRQAQSGDIIYIHFSGHGQRITDLDGDEPDGYDEAWIPYDALERPDTNYHGERHITDDLLNDLLLQIRQQIGNAGRLIVASDACHSGDGTRAKTSQGQSIPEVIRGSSKFEITPAHPVARIPQRTTDWLSIAACDSTQCNRQTITPEGIPCGSLSYALYLLRNDLSAMTAEQLSQRLISKLRPPLIARPQTPKVEGPKYVLSQPVLP